MQRARVVLADDHPAIAEELRRLLDASFDVVAVVHSGAALVETGKRLLPDVIVTDISMPGMDGMEAARLLRASVPALRIVFVTVHDDVVLARVAVAADAGYVLKAFAGDELIDAVNAVLRGDGFVSSALRLAPLRPASHTR